MANVVITDYIRRQINFLKSHGVSYQREKLFYIFFLNFILLCFVWFGLVSFCFCISVIYLRCEIRNQINFMWLVQWGSRFWPVKLSYSCITNSYEWNMFLFIFNHKYIISFISKFLIFNYYTLWVRIKLNEKLTSYVHLGTIASSVKVTGLSRRLTGFNVSFCWLYFNSRLLNLTS